MYRAIVLTSSDSGYAGRREDLSGPTARGILELSGFQVVESLLLPDEPERLREQQRQQERRCLPQR